MPSDTEPRKAGQTAHLKEISAKSIRIIAVITLYQDYWLNFHLAYKITDWVYCEGHLFMNVAPIQGDLIKATIGKSSLCTDTNLKLAIA